MAAVGSRIALAAATAAILGGMYLHTRQVGWAMSFVVAPFVMAGVDAIWRLRADGRSRTGGAPDEATMQEPGGHQAAVEPSDLADQLTAVTDASGTAAEDLSDLPVPATEEATRRVTKERTRTAFADEHGPQGDRHVDSPDTAAHDSESLVSKADRLLLRTWDLDDIAPKQVSDELDAIIDEILREAAKQEEAARADPSIGAILDDAAQEAASTDPGRGARTSGPKPDKDARGLNRRTIKARVTALSLQELVAEARSWSSVPPPVTSGHTARSWRDVTEAVASLLAEAAAFDRETGRPSDDALIRERLAAFVILHRAIHGGRSAEEARSRGA